MSVIVVCVYIFLISIAAPLYVVNKLEMKFFPDRSKTLLGLVFAHNRDEVEKVVFPFNNVFINFLSFSVITASTCIIAVQLNIKSKWRQTCTSGRQFSNISRRNQKVAKMVVIISCVFIVCFSPVSVLFLVVTLKPNFSFSGKYRYTLMFCGGIGLILESINASVNIFLYHAMSSTYRLTLHRMFHPQVKVNNTIHII